MKGSFKKISLLIFIMSYMCSCSHKPSVRLVGSDRDEHGCIASAGYVWSEARKDCIRLWEVGEIINNGNENVYVVFANDSSVAEVFAGKDRVLCRKDKSYDIWKSKKHKTKVTITDGILKLSINNKELIQNKQ